MRVTRNPLEAACLPRTLVSDATRAVQPHPPLFLSIVPPFSNLYPIPNLSTTLIHKFSLNLTLTFKDKAGGPGILAPKSCPGLTMGNSEN